ncbi:MAG TPA: signal peptidase II [Candidatus Aquicultor sp.]
MFLAIIALVVIVLDQATKVFIRLSMASGDSIPVIPGVLHITYVKNPGAAFGMLPNHQFIFLIVSVLVIMITLSYYWFARPVDKLSKVSFGLVLGGAFGNLIDRVYLGKVTDFIDFRIWPVFNVADSAIVIGIGLVILMLLSSARKEVVQAKQPSS